MSAGLPPARPQARMYRIYCLICPYEQFRELTRLISPGRCPFCGSLLFLEPEISVPKTLEEVDRLQMRSRRGRPPRWLVEARARGEIVD